MSASRSEASAEIVDLLVIGAGPNGLSCALEAVKAGFRVVVVDKGCICNSLFHYPSQMTFFTSADLLEIGGIPFACPNPKPSRAEALQYYRRVAEHYRLDIRQYMRVAGLEGTDGNFGVQIVDRFGRATLLRARKIVVAIGYFDQPNLLSIPGEELGKLQHYYFEAHPFSNQEVLVVGGKNSAAIAALELWRNGAHVTLVHRGDAMHNHVKYWIKPEIENRFKHGQIKAYFNSTLVEITPDAAILETPKGRVTLANDFVFALTGYHPDFSFLEKLGIEIKGEDRMPSFDPVSLESNVPGIYLAGVIVAGRRTNEVFIENGRFHGKQIAVALESALGRDRANC